MINTTSSDQQRADTEKQVLKHFRVLLTAMKEHFQNVEQISGLSGSQLWALSLIKNTPGIKVNEIAECMAIMRSSASNLLDKLEEKKLIRRERKDSDQRVVRLYPSEAGLELTKKISMSTPPEGIILHAVHQLSEEHLLELEASLHRLIQSLDYHSSEQSSLVPLSEI